MKYITDAFQQALLHAKQQTLEPIGIVISVGDGLCHIRGLAGARLYERVSFAGGNKGVVMAMQAYETLVFLLESTCVCEGEIVHRTHALMSCFVGNSLLGRVVDVEGMPLDGFALDFATLRQMPLEQPAPGIIDRTPINESLPTGTLAIDALVPIGKGQRELIIGNRATGKTTLIFNAIVSQKNRNVVCVYVSIGQRMAHVARFADSLAQAGALDYTVIVAADAAQASMKRYMAPYSGCAIAEYFQKQGRDVLIIYDDLSAHAVVYREMSLLMRRFPGREAYPGDVFYLHARLLERAGKFANGGSITALPIAETQADDITAYIPTNLISITDGQIFLDGKLFNQGIRPAINVELSVSRVGGSAQTAAMKKVVRALRLELAQYHELVAFAQFGSDLDAVSRKRLMRGRAIVELLKQEEHELYPWQIQVLMLFAMRQNLFDGVPDAEIKSCAQTFALTVREAHQSLYDELTVTQDLSPELCQALEPIAIDICRLYKVS